jgi:hypothetical protein
VRHHQDLMMSHSDETGRLKSNFCEILQGY